MTTPEEQAAEVLRDVLHAVIDGDFLIDGDGERVALSRAGAADVVRWATDALAPLFAEERRKGAEAGWDEGYGRGADDEAALSRGIETQSVNPYRARAGTYAEGGERDE